MRLYKKDGKEVPSVTTILSILGSVELMKWANSLGFKHIDYMKELNRTAVRGTKIHNWIEKEIDINRSSEELKFIDTFEEDLYLRVINNFRRLINNYKYETIYSEKELISLDLGYGGTMDWYVDINDKKLIIDYKTSKKVNFKHLLQIGAYYNLLVEKGYHVDGGGIIIVNERVASLYVIGLDTIKELGAVFNILADYYNKSTNLQYSHDSRLSEELLYNRENNII